MSKLIYVVEHSLANADIYTSKITDEILRMDGMSGIKTRHFYNNICSMNDARYLEIGTWKGSSICSAMCKNKMTCVAIDNWSEFADALTSKIFFQNFNNFKGNNKATFIEKNCWDIDVTKLGKFNIYMYDGNHSKTSHFQALNHYLHCLDDEFIYLVDDWNWKDVRDGTLKSIKNNNVKILYQKQIFTNQAGVPDWGPGTGNRFGIDGDWHNGISIFVLNK